MKLCRIEGCRKIATEKRTVCNSCRMRKRRTGSYDGLPLTREEKFWSRVNKTDSCWLWTGCIGYSGYGLLTTRVPIRAHRFSWELHNNKIPDNLHVCHKCDVRHCVNPEHLFLGTHKDNMNDMISKGRLVPVSKSGEEHIFSKLTENSVIEIKKMLNDGETCVSISKKYHVSPTCISRIKQNITWKHVNVN